MIQPNRKSRICIVLMITMFLLGTAPAAAAEEAGYSPQKVPRVRASGTVQSGVAASEYGPGGIISQEEIQKNGLSYYFTQQSISSALFRRMYGRTYKKECTTPREELRYLKVLYRDFDGNARSGEIVCNQAISDDLLDIFRELYEADYRIERIRLCDAYGGSDDKSGQDNNTYSFNWRYVMGRSSLSLHARGMAIDINPLYNPYFRYTADGSASLVCPVNAGAYMDRTADFEHKIDENDLCCRLFKEHGFSWGGDFQSEKDYMHFFKRQ